MNEKDRFNLQNAVELALENGATAEEILDEVQYTLDVFEEDA
jgi:hypothetical protein